VAKAAHAVVQEGPRTSAGGFGGGLKDHEERAWCTTDGTVTDGPSPESSHLRQQAELS